MADLGENHSRRLTVVRPQIVRLPRCPIDDGGCGSTEVKCYCTKGSGTFKSTGYYKCRKCGTRFQVVRI